MLGLGSRHPPILAASGRQRHPRVLPRNAGLVRCERRRRRASAHSRERAGLPDPRVPIGSYAGDRVKKKRDMPVIASRPEIQAWWAPA